MTTEIEKTLSNYKNILKKSPTAYSPGASPTQYDLDLESEVKSLESRVEREKADRLKEQWYTPKPEGALREERGAIGRGLHALATPLYTIVGGVEAALGKGTKKGLWDNIVANVEESGTMGDLLRSYGMNNMAAMPLGFALDVAFDPINWLTLGTSAIVPRTVYGGYIGAKTGKGAVKGAALGFGSSMRTKAEAIGRIVPGLSKRASLYGKLLEAGKTAVMSGDELATKVGKVSLGSADDMGMLAKLYYNVSKASNKGRTLYDDFIGETMEQYLTRQAAKTRITTRVVNKLDDVSRKWPVKAKDVMYSPPTWTKEAREAAKLGKGYEQVFSKEVSKEAKKAMAAMDDYLKAKTGSTFLDEFSAAARVIAGEDQVVKVLSKDEALSMASKLKKGKRVSTDFFWAGEADEVLKTRLFKKGLYHTDFLAGAGVDITDTSSMTSAMRKFVVQEDVIRRTAREHGQIAVAQGIQNEIKRMGDLFEGEKGGMVAKLLKLDNFERKEMAELFQTFKSGSESSLFKWYDKQIVKAVMSPGWKNFLKYHSYCLNFFKNIKIGLNPAALANNTIGNVFMTGMAGVDIADARYWSEVSKALKAVKKSGNLINFQYLLKNKKWMDLIARDPDIFKAAIGIDPHLLLNAREYVDDFARNYSRIGKSVGAVDEYVDDAMRIVNETVTGHLARSASFQRAINATGDVSGVGQSAATGFLASEVLQGQYGQLMTKLKKAGEGKDSLAAFYKALHKTLTGSMDVYSKVDQMFRLGFSTHLADNGISSKELRLLAKRFFIPVTDIVKVADVNRYTIAPARALEISLETYLNYLAMPSFVKVMRTLPIVGMPFMSFALGMTANTLKTGIYNPAYFNKVQFLLKEIAGRKAPSEKAALDTQYYSWLKKPGMVKIPFFQKNPVYLNMANMIPYYTMNLLQPPERNYESRFGKTVANILDKSWFMKTPEGQVLMDYVALPMLIRNEQPQGFFGQPTWPKDAGVIKKGLYASRAMGEAIMPPVAGVAGLVTPEAALPFIPSYRWRQLGYAVRGKTSLGIPSKEPSFQRTARILSAMAGIPLYSIRPQFGKNK